MDTLRIYAEKAGRLSHWRDRDKYYALFPQFTEEALRFCMAEQKSSGGTIQELAKHFQAPQAQSAEQKAVQQLYSNCGNIGITPYWFFYDTAPGAQRDLVDVSSFTTTQPFNQLYKVASTPNRRVRDKLLGYPWMRKSWDAMSTIIRPVHGPKSGFR
jgi:hypothetical protein